MSIIDILFIFIFFCVDLDSNMDIINHVEYGIGC